MDLSVWKQYVYNSDNEIVQSLLQEEINQQVRYQEKISFSCVTSKLIKTSLIWGLLSLVFFLHYLFTNSLDRDFGGAVRIIVVALLWLIQVCIVSNKHAAKYLAREAIKSPETPFSQLVAEDIQEQRLAGSKLIHILLCIAVILGSLAIPIIDRCSEIHEAGMVFKPYQGGCALVDCVDSFIHPDVVIPEQVQGKTVVAIDSGAFMDDQYIVSVSIPSTVTSIGGEAFSGCTKLESVVIPKGVMEIRGNCFENCIRLKQVVLHEGITAIHGYAFRNCTSLEEIKLPGGITEIRGNCFENCTSLKSIEIPEGVTRIAAHAFMGCKALESVKVPSTVLEIGSSAFRQCPELETIVIPSEAAVDERSFKESPTLVVRR